MNLINRLGLQLSRFILYQGAWQPPPTMGEDETARPFLSSKEFLQQNSTAIEDFKGARVLSLSR